MAKPPPQNLKSLLRFMKTIERIVNSSQRFIKTLGQIIISL